MLSLVAHVGRGGAVRQRPAQNLTREEPPIVKFIGEELVEQFRITTWEIWHVGDGSINGVMWTESDALVLTRVSMGEAPGSFDDRVYVMWSIRLRAHLGYKNAGAYGGWRAQPDRWGPPTSIKEEALCNAGCQYEPVRSTFGIYFPLAIKEYSHIRAMVSPTDAQLPDFYLTYLAAEQIMADDIYGMPKALRGYESFRSPQVTWIGQFNRSGGLRSERFFADGNIWRDEYSEDNEFWNSPRPSLDPEHRPR